MLVGSKGPIRGVNFVVRKSHGRKMKGASARPRIEILVSLRTGVPSFPPNFEMGNAEVEVGFEPREWRTDSHLVQEEEEDGSLEMAR